MAINIMHDLIGNPEPPTIILSTRSGNKLGQLDINADSFDLADKLNEASEFTFTLNKYVDEEITNLWGKVVDFKLVWCKEWDMWFEIKVELDEETETVKTVTATQLGYSELSQIKLYNIEINTEADIERDDYKISILYDKDNPKASILNRMLEKAPHYSITHVDPTIAKIQRSFSFDDTSIDDGFQEIAEEIGCLFQYPSGSDKETGKVKREIRVYDLQQNCNDCGHRGEFTDKCPKCGSTNIKYGYGKDTKIFVTSDELASGGIQLVTDTDSVKNCFKLEAGDDLMTATVRNCNPNGTDYIWRFSDITKEDMSDELVDRLESYDEQYRYYYNEHKSELDNELLNEYNALVEKYSEYNEELQPIETPIVGYSPLMNAYYNVIDLALYLKSGLMPSIEMSETNAEERGLLLETSLPSLIAVTNLKSVSPATANSTVLTMAKAIVGSSYKVEIGSSGLEGDNWSGNFVITNYSDEEDIYTTGTISRTLTDWDEEFIKQKIEKLLSKENTDNLSISGLFKKELVTELVDGEHNFSGEFYEELKKYALNPLNSFHNACQACIDILIEQGVGNGDTWSDTEEGSEGNLYENLYVPYYNKLMAIESEMKVRENEISIVSGAYNTDGDLTAKGLQANIEECRKKIQDELNFENYLDELWLEFCAYRREDKYSNENYISDGLNNAELFKRALEFFEIAENEIYKASETQCSISTTLNNLLAIPKFKPLVESFELGNWIRIRVDDVVYRLRLIEYGIDFGDFNTISVEFSDLTKIKDGASDVKDILSQASSMASSYGSVKRQASQGEKGNAILTNWVENGLSATNTEIVGGYDNSLLFGKNGFLCRQYDPITDTYSDEQIKIVNSTIAITDDNWKTTKTAIGKYYYIDPITGEQKMAYGVNGETIVGQFILGENMSMRNESGTMIFDGNGLNITNNINTVTINPNDKEVMNITNGTEKVFNVNEDGDLSINGNIMARSLQLESGVKIDSGVITNLANVATSGSYDDLLDTPTKLSEFNNDVGFITNSVDNLTNYHTKTNVNNLLSSKANTSDVYTKTEVNNLLNSKVDTSYIDELKTWVLEQIQLAMS